MRRVLGFGGFGFRVSDRPLWGLAFILQPRIPKKADNPANSSAVQGKPPARSAKQRILAIRIDISKTYL